MSHPKNTNAAGANRDALPINELYEPSKGATSIMPAQAAPLTGRELFRQYPGLDLLPLPRGAKHPRGLAYNDRTFCETDFSASEPQNIGLRFSGAHVDADLDCLEAVELAPHFLHQTTTWGRAGKPRSHWLYVCASAAAEGARMYHDIKGVDGAAPMLVEQRCGHPNKLSVLPGSTWVCKRTGATEAIDVHDSVAPAEIDPTEAIRALACATVLVRNWAADRDGAKAALREHYTDLKAQHILNAIDGFNAARPARTLAPVADQAKAHARIAEWFGVRTGRVSAATEDWPEPDVLTLDAVAFEVVVNAITAAYPEKQRDLYRLNVAGMLHEKRLAADLIADVLLEARRRVPGPIDAHAIEHSERAAYRDWDGRAGRVVAQYGALGRALVDIVERVHPNASGLGSLRPSRRDVGLDGKLCPDALAPAPDAPAAPANDVVRTETPSVGAQVVAQWDPETGPLDAAPRDVSRAIRNARKALPPGAQRDLGPDSRKALTWMFQQHASPDGVCAWLGRPASALPELRKLSTEAIASACERDGAVAVGRLSKIDALLRPLDLRWNEMKMRVEVGGEPWSDLQTAQARLRLELDGSSDPDKPMPNADIEQRRDAIAHENAYHPVVEYLEGLPAWDGKPRVDSLWPRYFSAVDSELKRALGACFMIGAARRVMHPGTKVDMMPILYGDQGERKSTALKVLAGAAHFTDARWNGKHRAENAMTLTGCWLWEIAELQGFDRDDQNDIKAFVTRAEDDVLLPWGRTKVTLPRRAIMIGTTNDEHCLKDPTGSRRHPVITIGALDLQALAADRDQLWAEALHRMKAGEQHWLTPELEHARAESNAAHERRDDVLIEALDRWFRAPHQADTFTMTDAIRGAGYPDRSHDRSLETRIGFALKAMGVKSRRIGTHKVKTYVFPTKEAPTVVSDYLALKY